MQLRSESGFAEVTYRVTHGDLVPLIPGTSTGAIWQRSLCLQVTSPLSYCQDKTGGFLTWQLASPRVYVPEDSIYERLLRT